MSTATHLLTSDTQSVLLLCGRFGQTSGTGPKPLSLSEYDRLAQWLHRRNLRPADLLDPGWPGDAPDASLPISIARLLELLERGAALALTVESWANKGLWVVSRSDDAYPRRLKSRLGRLAPPLLFGVGEAVLLSRGGLAVVGSRNVDDAAVDATRQVAQTCAQQGIQIVSGGARGVDTEAMLTAVEMGGSAVGMLADSLARAAVAGKYRRALLEGKLVLASPYDPESGFNVGNAMSRNKYIYALADWGLVISAALREGGTWAGAVEALKQSPQPVFVWTRGAVSAGNNGLLALGALPFPPEPWPDLAEILTHASVSPAVTQTAQAPLLLAPTPANGVSLQGEVWERAQVPETAEPLHSSDAREGDSAVTDRVAQPRLAGNLFAVVLPVLLDHLEQPRNVDTLVERLDVRRSQLQDWLDRAVTEGHVTKMTKPIRYVAVRHEQAPLAL